jgi:hypothetical protein
MAIAVTHVAQAIDIWLGEEAGAPVAALLWPAAWGALPFRESPGIIILQDGFVLIAVGAACISIRGVSQATLQELRKSTVFIVTDATEPVDRLRVKRLEFDAEPQLDFSAAIEL